MTLFKRKKKCNNKIMKKKITPFGGYILLQSEIKCHAKIGSGKKRNKK